LTGITFDEAMSISFESVMAAALWDPACLPKLGELVKSATVDGLLRIGIATADLLLCWTLGDVPVPPAVESLARAALAGVRRPGLRGEADVHATRQVLARLAGEATPEPALRPPPDLGWEELSTWAEAAGPLAAPALDGGVLLGRETDLLRGLALAIQQERWERAATLLRWLALHPAASEWASDVQRARTRVAYQIHQQTDENRATLVAAAVQLIPAIVMSRSAKALAVPVTVAAPAAELPGPPAGVRRELTDRTLAWLSANLPRFEMPDGEGERALAGAKAIADLGLIAWLAISSGDPRLAASGRAAADHGWAQLGEGRRLTALIEKNPKLSAFVTLYSFFYRLGHRSEALERVIRQHADAAPIEIAALMVCNLDLVGIEPPARVAEAAARAPYGPLHPPWMMRRSESYYVTHVVFALSDFGRRPLSAGVDHVQRWLPEWLRWCEVSGDHDLLAEMIMTWHCALPGCVPGSAWTLLRDAQRADGSIPFSARSRATPLYVDYHTTLVALAALAMCRHPAVAPG
jgi:hypothetical protein